MSEQRDVTALSLKMGDRDISLHRTAAEEALREYGEAAKFWNAPDDEHTRWQIRRVAEDIIEEMFPRG